MPEFILDHGSPEASKQFAALDSFTQGYIEAMFFTDAEHNTVRPDEDSQVDDPNVWNPEIHSGLPGDVVFAELSPEALEACISACISFQDRQADLLEAATALEPGSPSFRYAREPLDDRRLGQLFGMRDAATALAFATTGMLTA